jgi:hypothetical protein
VPQKDHLTSKPIPALLTSDAPRNVADQEARLRPNVKHQLADVKHHPAQDRPGSTLECLAPHGAWLHCLVP